MIRRISGKMNQCPLIFRIRQKFDTPRVDNLPGAAEDRLSRLSLGNTIKPGQKWDSLVDDMQMIGYAGN